jgi:dihydrofolate synthase/folylpolyglutamate synthase
VKFNERICVDGEMIRDEDVARLYTEIKPHAAAMAAESETNQPTFFETTSAMAFRHFAEQRVDLAVVEVGMGGRLDATNVVRPDACAITRIGLEHTENLGRTIERIAREKAGILKPSVPAVTVAQPALKVIQERAKELGCPLTVVGRDVRYSRTDFDLDGQHLILEDGLRLDAFIPLLGSYQPENAATAYAVALVLREKWNLTREAIVEGLATARWPGRLQVVRDDPLVIVDGAHNAPAAAAVAESLQELFPGQKVTFVVGVLSDKDLGGIADALGPLAAKVYACRAKTPRTFQPEEVGRAFGPYAPVDIVPEAKEAVQRAVDDARGDVVVVTGSIYVAGEALELLGGWE